MTAATEQMLLNIKAQYKDEGTRTLTQEEWQVITDDPIRCRLSYFQFIEHINRTGRVLKQKSFTPPLYRRIYFLGGK